MEQVYKNAKLVMHICGLAHIPVMKGDKLVKEKECDFFYGRDGLGNSYEKYEQKHRLEAVEIEKKESAIDFLLEQTAKYPNEVTIIALAPLTNIAHAQEKDPTFQARIRNIVILGGSFQGKGNTVNCCTEFNFFNDP
mmetsp:Transcript_49163/g.36217  ORF Transcript_49163/g.36217 Transcript_49163/m.36217 type:complete len:137 (+) Transcript_49163:228-638(+)